MEAKERYKLNRKIAEEQFPERREIKNEKQNNRYKNDPVYREQCKQRAKINRERKKKENPELLFKKEKEIRDRAIQSGKMKTHQNNYRARKREAYIESVDFNKVYERDKGICHICGAKTKKNYQKGIQPPNYATLDHLVPLIHGGLHCYDNVKIACKSCNSAKSDNIPREGIQMNLFAQPGVTKRKKESTAHLPHAERKKIWQQRYHEKNRDEINRKHRERRAKNKELGIKEKRPDKEYMNEYYREYYQKNIEKKREFYRQRYQRKKSLKNQNN